MEPSFRWRTFHWNLDEKEPLRSIWNLNSTRTICGESVATATGESPVTDRVVMFGVWLSRYSFDVVEEPAHRRTPWRRVRGSKGAGDAQLQGGGRSYAHHNVVPRRPAGDDCRRQPVVASDAAANRTAVLSACGSVRGWRTALWCWQVLLQGDKPGDRKQRNQPWSVTLRCRLVCITNIMLCCGFIRSRNASLQCMHYCIRVSK